MSREGWRIAKLAEEAIMIRDEEASTESRDMDGRPDDAVEPEYTIDSASASDPEVGTDRGVEPGEPEPVAATEPAHVAEEAAGAAPAPAEAAGQEAPQPADGERAPEPAERTLAVDAERVSEIEAEEAVEAGMAEEAVAAARDSDAETPTAVDDADADADAELSAEAETAGEAIEAAAAAEPDPAARPEELRLLEALLFAASEPVDEKALGRRLPAGTDVRAMLMRLQLEYAPRGVNLVHIGQKWSFRTANDLAWLLTHEAKEPKKLSRAAVETLAIVAYHQPVTRAEIEDIRGVAVAKGTLDLLLETGWIRPRGRRKAPGRPVTYGTTDTFLSHFGLEVLSDLPGLDELKGAGLFDGQLPAGFAVPAPSDDPALREDEDPLEPTELDLGLLPRQEDLPPDEQN